MIDDLLEEFGLGESEQSAPSPSSNRLTQVIKDKPLKKRRKWTIPVGQPQFEIPPGATVEWLAQPGCRFKTEIFALAASDPDALIAIEEVLVGNRRQRLLATIRGSMNIRVAFDECSGDIIRVRLKNKGVAPTRVDVLLHGTAIL